MYADDSQLYIIVRQSNRTSATALQDLALCIQDIMSWNVGNMLIDNPKKTEIIHLTFYIAPEPVPAIKAGDCSITPSSEVKGLGVTLDRLFTFKTHIQNICRSLHVLFTTSEKLGTFHLDLLQNVLFVQFFF